MLENILIDYFGLNENWESKDEWYVAYNKLVELVYALGRLGVLPRGERIVDLLDEIDSEED